jgi:hypothetical protein
VNINLGWQTLIVLLAGTRSEGLIDGCNLVFLAKSKDGDYHQEMNSFVFLEWFENQLMPALKNPSLIVSHIFCNFSESSIREFFSIF